MDKFLVAHWPFDEHSGDKIIDVTGNGDDGKINGGTWVAGKCKSALEFNGKADHVVIPDSKDLDWAQELTSFCLGQISGAESRRLEELGSKRGAYVVEITGQNKLQRMFGWR